MATRSYHRLTYPRRLFLWLLGYSVLLVGCFAAFQYRRERAFKAGEMNARLQTINTYILTELEAGTDMRDISLADFHPFEDIRVSVISGEGEVVYDNSIDSLPGQNHLNREEIRRAMKQGAGYTVRRHSESTGGVYFYSATRGGGGSVVRTAVPYSIPLATLLRPDFNFMWTMGAVAFAMCLLGYFATRRLGLHITRLNRFARDVERGARISDTEPFPNDELGSISNNIVRLYARLQQAQADRDSEHRAALYEQREKERIKKQLTNNINHELRTPVASIRICVETLLAHSGMDGERREGFLRRALANVERLQRLLDDVSLITRMDDGRAAVGMEPVDLAQTVRTSVGEHRLLAEARGITIDNGLPPALPMTGNPPLLGAIFDNLLANAIAYSGGTAITLRLTREDGERLELTLADNGTGVAEEHLPRLFERFYRIDKGRSRAAGGTGLGLSIVRNAVSLHGGSITTENAAGGGLLFTITLARTPGGTPRPA